jgi:glycosyltransferase 2 family protein
MARMSPGGGRIRRRRTDAGWLAAGGGVMLLTGGAIDGNTATDAEVAVFRLVNDAPDALFYVLWVPMQFGTFVAVPVSAIGAFVSRRPRLAIETAVTGTAAYFLARSVKLMWVRLRPPIFVSDVHLRHVPRTGYGFVSGHAAVSASLAFVLWAFLPKRWRWVPAAVAGIVGLGRMYVGGHMPLDVLGGWGLGTAVGAVVTFVGGVPREQDALEVPEGADPG